MLSFLIPKRNKGLIAASILAVALSGGAASSDAYASQAEASLVEDYPVHQRAQDLAYGQVLFDYHQGNFFEALSALNVAKLRSGIQGHGEHPELVEGGLMLAYGMIDEAKAVFEALLDKQISVSDRNQAWYYLGKVYFLLERDDLSVISFSRVDEELLRDEKTELYYEMHYMNGLILARDDTLRPDQKHDLLADQLRKLAQGGIWRHYLQYNTLIGLLNVEPVEDREERQQKVIEGLSLLAKELSVSSEPLSDLENEHLNLREQCLLSLGQLHLQRGDSRSAFEVLKQIRKDSLLSDQALFAYAVSATNLGMHGLALEALTVLKERPKFTPWIQQVPYALAYLYEQMSEPSLALQAYRTAVAHYESQLNELETKQQKIDESTLIDGLYLLGELGSLTFGTDAYGKIDVEPRDFNFAHLLASETFQRELGNLHELYKLEASLLRWERQLGSFDTMMETRISLRNSKIQQTSAAMEAQNAAQWESERAKYSKMLEAASVREDHRFFMNENQIEYANRIKEAEAKLSVIPHDHRKRKQYEKRLNRVKAYFDWWLSDSYSTNQWAAMKQMRALDREMNQFHVHQSDLDQVMASDGGNQALADRVTEGRKRLSVIREELVMSQEQTRQKLLLLAKQDYDKQKAEATIYLHASREALARVSDQVYHTTPESRHSNSELSDLEGGPGIDGQHDDAQSATQVAEEASP